MSDAIIAMSRWTVNLPPERSRAGSSAIAALADWARALVLEPLTPIMF